MAAIAQSQPSAPRGGATHAFWVAVTLVWVVIGPIANVAWEYRVNTRDWSEIAAMPAVQQESLRAQYYTETMYSYVVSSTLWAAVLLALAMLAWFSRERPQR